MKNILFSIPSRQKLAQIKKGVRSTLAIALFIVLALSILAGTAASYAQTNVQAQVTPQSMSIAQLYQNVENSVVVITDLQPQSTVFGQSYAPVEGSGFVYKFNGSMMVVVTNNHVIYQGINISVTFKNGNGYEATVLGADPYADLAVLSVDAPANEFIPLQIANSSALSVGDFVAAVGTPFGLSGSITTGIVSQLGRTITESTAGNYPIADVIQTDAPINPGNSGGPLLNSEGQVVGINTAGVSGSQGVGFAIPSNTILREINALVTTGNYTQHPYIGIGGVDMNYNIAKQIGLNVTYGVLIQQVTSGGPADNAGLKGGTTQVTVDGTALMAGGDDIIAINGVRIINTDDLSSYLEQNTLPDQTITVTINRNNQIMNISVTLGTRPPPGVTSSPTPSPSPVASATTPAVPEIPALALMITMAVGSCTLLVFMRWRVNRVSSKLKRNTSENKS